MQFGESQSSLLEDTRKRMLERNPNIVAIRPTTKNRMLIKMREGMTLELAL